MLPNKRSLTISVDDLVADEAQVAEELMVVQLAVGLPLLLVVPVAQEGLLALGAHKVLHVPVLAQGGHHPLLDGAPTGPADGDAHLVVAAQTIQLILTKGKPK